MLGILVLLGVASTAWLAFRAVQVQDNLEASIDLLPQLQDQLVAGDSAGALQSLDSLRSHTAEARVGGTDPLWKAASILPIIGPNLSAITEVTVSADDVVTRAVAPMLERFDSLDWDSLAPQNGRIEVGPLQEVSPTLNSAANTVQLSYERLANIDRTRLLPQVATPLEQAVTTLGEARQTLNSASSAAQILPSMLGADEPRTYMVLIQNSAEIRATGGIPGAYALIRTDGGAIELVGQGSATEMGRFNPPLDVDLQQVQIYSSRLGGFLQSANLTPDFPTVALTAKSMYEERNEGQRVDGVLAMDAVVLSKLLGVTGPVELNDIEDPLVEQLISQTALPEFLTADNVVDTLLSDVYSEIEEPEFQDIYFAAVAGEVFSTLSEGAGDNAGLIDALTQSTEEHRLYLWSNNRDEQQVIASTQLGGAVTGPLKGGAAFDVYFNDGTGAKMDYYVERTVQLIQSCTEEGYRTYTAQVILTNTAPADAATSLPRYVTGGAAFGVPEGNVRTNVVAYGPAQAAVAAARINEEEVPLGSFLHGNRPVGMVTTELAPGESVTVELSFINVVQSDDPVLSVTPTIQPVTDVVQPTQVDASCN